MTFELERYLHESYGTASRNASVERIPLLPLQLLNDVATDSQFTVLPITTAIEEPSSVTLSSSSRGISDDGKTTSEEHPAQQSFTSVITLPLPTTVNLDVLLGDCRLRRDALAFICHLYWVSPKDADGWTPIHSLVLRRLVHEYNHYINALLASGVLTLAEQRGTPASSCVRQIRRFRFASPHDTATEAQFVVSDPGVRAKVVAWRIWSAGSSYGSCPKGDNLSTMNGEENVRP